MQVTVYTEATAFDSLAESWQDLLSRAIHAPFFMTTTYQKLWWDYLGEGQLNIIAIHTAEEQLVGLAPLFLKDGQLCTVGCVDVSDYLDFLVDRDHSEAVYATLINYLADDLSDWTSAYFCSLPHHSPTPSHVLPLAEAKGWTATSEVEEVCPVITLAETWDEYLANIDKKQRHEIRRKLRRAKGIARTEWFVVETPEDVTDELLDTFIDLHQSSTVEKEDFWDDKLIAFFKALIHQTAAEGWLKLYFIKMHDTISAVLLCFDYQNEILVYNSGYDPTNFGHLSPGNVIVSYSIQHAIELGRSRYDFLRGDEVYKFRFGAEAEDVLNVRISK